MKKTNKKHFKKRTLKGGCWGPKCKSSVREQPVNQQPVNQLVRKNIRAIEYRLKRTLTKDEVNLIYKNVKFLENKLERELTQEEVNWVTQVKPGRYLPGEVFLTKNEVKLTYEYVKNLEKKLLKRNLTPRERHLATHDLGESELSTGNIEYSVSPDGLEYYKPEDESSIQYWKSSNLKNLFNVGKVGSLYEDDEDYGPLYHTVANFANKKDIERIPLDTVRITPTIVVARDTLEGTKAAGDELLNTFYTNLTSDFHENLNLFNKHEEYVNELLEIPNISPENNVEKYDRINLAMDRDEELRKKLCEYYSEMASIAKTELFYYKDHKEMIDQASSWHGSFIENGPSWNEIIKDYKSILKKYKSFMFTYLRLYSQYCHNIVERKIDLDESWRTVL